MALDEVSGPPGIRSRAPEPLARWLDERLTPLPGRPCSARTHQCKFWTWPPGSPRPPCCTRHLVELLGFTHELLATAGIVHWADYGTLLGAVRGGRLIPWDGDADFGVLATDLDRIRALAPQVEAAGYLLSDADPYLLKVVYSARNGAHVDLFPWRRDGEQMRLRFHEGWNWPGVDQYRFPAHYLDQLATVSLEGVTLPAPNPPDRFLAEERFGPDYRTPIRPILHTGRYPQVSADQRTPTLLALFDVIAAQEAAMRYLEVGRFPRLGRLWLLERWARAGHPSTPPPELVEARRREFGRTDADPLIEQCLAALALLDATVAELRRAGPAVRWRRLRRRWAGRRAATVRG